MTKSFNAELAKRMLSVLDLVDLKNDVNIAALCEKARSKYGDIAAVCVLPKYVTEAKLLLDGSSVKVTTVVNFPGGDLNTYKALTDIKNAILLGADEVDVVFPYHALLNRQAGMCLKFIEDIRNASEGKTLKVILECGALESLKWIRKASEIVVRGSADFIQTSTGTHDVNSTLRATEIILTVIKELEASERVGIKVAGGVSNFKDASSYLEQALHIMGPAWVTEKHFRFGEFVLYDALLTTIQDGAQK